MYRELEITSSGSIERLTKQADRQFGRITWPQLRDMGIASSTLTTWVADGYLHRVLPRVYAVGHRAPSIEADLSAALLYAGPGAALSHTTAAWWLGLIDERPRAIQVTTPRRCRSRPGIRVHARRQCERFLHKDLPVTLYPQTLIDLAATVPLRSLRKALANADYQGVLDLGAIEQLLGKGTRGASKLRNALEAHQPKLAWTKSRLEARLVEICEQEDIELPELNVYIDGWLVDALWRKARLAVELDGHGNHHTPAQLRRDRRKEMALRAQNLTPIRYSEDQLIDRTGVVRELKKLTDP